MTENIVMENRLVTIRAQEQWQRRRKGLWLWRDSQREFCGDGIDQYCSGGCTKKRQTIKPRKDKGEP